MIRCSASLIIREMETHQIVYIRYLQFLYVTYTSIKLKNMIMLVIVL